MDNLVSEDGEIYLIEKFLDADTADILLEALRQELKWEQPTVRLFGKSFLIPRLISYIGEPHVYTYSGVVHNAVPLPDSIQNIKGRIEKLSGCGFTNALVNYYRDGNDSMGWHSDNEKELGLNPTIASLSLGAERIFKLKHNSKAIKLDLKLPHGSLLIMKGSLQHHYKHAINKTKKVTEPRMNLTFRRMMDL